MYQLILTDEALHGFSSLYHVQPPLRGTADRDGLREAVKAGVISTISSHHQPHEADAKLAPFGETEPGISSAEILLPLAMTLVDDGLLDLPTLARLPAARPRCNCPPADCRPVSPPTRVLFDPHSSTTVGGTRKGATVRSWAMPARFGALHVVDGHISYGPERRRPGRLLARSGPGFSAELRPARDCARISVFSVQKS